MARSNVEARVTFIAEARFLARARAVNRASPRSNTIFSARVIGRIEKRV